MTRGHIGCPPKIHPTAYQHCKRMDHLNPRIRGFWHPSIDAMTLALRVRQSGGGLVRKFPRYFESKEPKNSPFKLPSLSRTLLSYICR